MESHAPDRRLMIMAGCVNRSQLQLIKHSIIKLFASTLKLPQKMAGKRRERDRFETEAFFAYSLSRAVGHQGQINHWLIASHNKSCIFTGFRRFAKRQSINRQRLLLDFKNVQKLSDT